MGPSGRLRQVRQSPAGPAVIVGRMTEVVILLTAAEARERVLQAGWPAEEAAAHLAFVNAFPDAEFFANTEEILVEYQQEQRVRLPAWFLLARRTLAEAYVGAQDLAVQFDGFTDHFSVGSALKKTVRGSWYTLSLPGLPRRKKDRQMYLRTEEGLHLFPIAVNVDDDASQLGINLLGEDTRIYAYHVEDIEAAFSAGEPVAVNVIPVFQSPGDLLSHVARIRHEGTITERVAHEPQ